MYHKISAGHLFQWRGDMD